MLSLNIGEGHHDLSTLEFISQMVGHLAWPTAAVLIALLFRKHLIDLFKNLDLEELGFGGAKAKFRKKLDEAEEKVEEAIANDPAPAPSQPDDPIASDKTPFSTFDAIANISNEAAIQYLYGQVDTALRDRYNRTATEHPNWLNDNLARNLQRNSVLLAKWLAAKNVISQYIADAFKDLRALRNVAAHGNVDNESVQRFRQLAAILIRYLSIP